MKSSKPGPDNLSNTHEMLAATYIDEGRTAEAERALIAALAIDVDAGTWRGVPFFQMRLGPVTACRLELRRAELRLWEDDAEGAIELVEGVRERCEVRGRIEARMRRLLPMLQLRRPDYVVPELSRDDEVSP